MRDRIRQFRETSVLPTPADREFAAVHLTEPLLALFLAQHPRDIVHTANTARWLAERGHNDPDLIGAALLHDIGKGEQRPWDRATYVAATHLRLTPLLASSSSRFAWRRAFARTRVHSQDGAAALRTAGASERVIDLTLRHHDAAAGDDMLALLQRADAAT